MNSYMKTLNIFVHLIFLFSFFAKTVTSKFGIMERKGEEITSSLYISSISVEITEYNFSSFAHNIKAFDMLSIKFI